MLPGNSPSNAQRPTYVLPTRSREGGKIQTIRDDWDADDDDDDDDDGDHSGETSTTTAPQQTVDMNVRAVQNDFDADVWREANTRAPMPEVIINPSGTRNGTTAPPVAALIPQMRILKRPSQSQSSNLSSSSAPPTQSTFAQREAQYLEARNRIFGVSNQSPASDVATVQSSDPTATADIRHNVSRQSVVTVLRDPLGPPSQSIIDQDGNRPGAGFGVDRRGRNLK
ncbi:hypothetical protein BKA82DRAFT_27771 [Pisolithus tinctorius]|nr:hypothetical protein BKA82DRAFT_27771 [Pisolithus tinctorius]